MDDLLKRDRDRIEAVRTEVFGAQPLPPGPSSTQLAAEWADQMLTLPKDELRQVLIDAWHESGDRWID
jgi:hypothetical protein